MKMIISLCRGSMMDQHMMTAFADKLFEVNTVATSLEVQVHRKHKRLVGNLYQVNAKFE
jgi:hypothetical protein